MLNAYVGIATTNGLAALRAEREDTLDWARRLVGPRSRSLAFWAVVPEEDAALASSLVNCGRQREALRILAGSAREMGSILPGDRSAAA